jgi:integrase/recombinase XerD
MTRGPPIACWPARDRELWNKGVEPRGLFGGGGAGAHWSAASRIMVACGYNAWLSWLTAKELLDPDLGPADRVTRERVARYVTELQTELAPYSVLNRVQELYDALRVMAPATNLKWLARFYQSLKAQVRPVRDKLSRVKPPQELIALGERLMDEAEAAPRWSMRRRAILYRDGVMIALLAYRPIRRKNLAMMRLGRHLMKVGTCWLIVFAAEETKTRAPYEAVLPEALGPRLERYLNVYRPVLLRGKQKDGNSDAPPVHPGLDAVWVSQCGTQLMGEELGFQIFVRTRREFGRGLFPHMFRDCVATAVAVDNPKHIGDASLILGHAEHRTTEKHYNHARSLDASRRHAAMLASLRESLNANGKRKSATNVTASDGKA